MFRPFLGALIILTATTALLLAEPLQFETSYNEILFNTFKMKAIEAGYLAKEGEVDQAGAIPNPQLTVTLNTIGREVDGNENELFIGVAQLIELGGKRSARMRVAEADRSTTGWEVEIFKAELYGDLLKSFIYVAVAQERMTIAEAQQEISLYTLDTISFKADAGKTSRLDQKKAQVSFSTAKLLLARQKIALSRAKKELQSFWNTPSMTAIESVTFPLDDIAAPPTYEQLTAAIESNPSLAKSSWEMLRAWEMVELERTKSIPDLSVQVGVTSERFYKQSTPYVGFAVPLPIFNRNQGNIYRAIHEYNQLYYRYENTLKDLKIKLSILHEEWIAAYEEASTIRDTIMPAAEETYQLSQESYEAGKFDYLHLLDARNTLFFAKVEYLEALEKYHLKRAEILKIIPSYD